jgi:hypothetical protein
VEASGAAPPSAPRKRERVRTPNPALESLEAYLHVDNIAESLGMSMDAVRKRFQNEPCVIHWQGAPKRGKRPYTTLLIPVSVFRRVLAAMQVPERQKGRAA